MRKRPPCPLGTQRCAGRACEHLGHHHRHHHHPRCSCAAVPVRTAALGVFLPHSPSCSAKRLLSLLGALVRSTSSVRLENKARAGAFR